MPKESYIHNNIPNRVTHILFTIYLLVLCWILLFKLGVQFSYMGERRVNFTPFREHVYLNGEIILNVLIFIPLGLYAGVLFKRWAFYQKLFFVFFISLLCEGLQFLLKIGAFDITDIITNTLGGLIGLIAYGAIEYLCNSSRKAQNIINIIASLGTVLVVVFLVLLKLDMGPIRYR